MIRVKNFNSTGVAPDGRLYAGDLLAIQDAAAGLSNFAQTIDLASLRIGDSTIQLVKFGTLDARLTAALRTDGILRGLGGFIAGAFTTAQRDAISQPPYGLMILNTTVNQYQWNAGTPSVPVWNSIGITNVTAVKSAYAGSVGGGGTYTITADAAGTYIIGWGAGQGNGGAQGSSSTITCNKAPGTSHFGDVGASGGPVFSAGVSLGAGEVVTFSVGGNGVGSAWATLTRIA